MFHEFGFLDDEKESKAAQDQAVSEMYDAVSDEHCCPCFIVDNEANNECD